MKTAAIGSRYPEWAISLNWHKNFALGRYLDDGLAVIAQAEADGIPQVAPLLVAFRGPPSLVRARLGRGLWRRVHHSDLALNARRADTWLRTALDFALIMDMAPKLFPSAASLVEQVGREGYAFVARRTARPKDAKELAHYVRDYLAMGGQLNPEWTVKRLREEHDREAAFMARRCASDAPWAEPWSWEHDGFIFTRLISDVDFQQEALTQKHCIASYAYRAKKGEQIAFRIEGRERATLMFSMKGRSAELKAARNGPVSDRLREVAPEVAMRFLCANPVGAPGWQP